MASTSFTTPLAVRRAADGGRVTGSFLDRRTLNRTLLARQGLMRRETWGVAETLRRLIGLQAQEPQNPFVALWTRLGGFEPSELDRLMEERRVVRTGLMRTTLHLVTDEDALQLQPIFAPVLARTLASQGAFRNALLGLDLGEVASFATSELEADPVPARELRQRLTERWPDRDPDALIAAVRYLVPIVQVPPRGLWRRTQQVTLTTMGAWLGRPPTDGGDLDAVVLRYLRSFGPASSSDLRTWSWLTGLAPVVERLRPELRRFRDESRRLLLDVEDGPIVDGREPAPPRFLPEYDNAFLSHADRRRIADGSPTMQRPARGTLLVDGFVAAGWRVEPATDSVTLEIIRYRPIARPARAAVEREAMELLAFLEPGSRHELRWRGAPGD